MAEKGEQVDSVEEKEDHHYHEEKEDHHHVEEKEHKEDEDDEDSFLGVDSQELLQVFEKAKGNKKQYVKLQRLLQQAGVVSSSSSSSKSNPAGVSSIASAGSSRSKNFLWTYIYIVKCKSASFHGRLLVNKLISSSMMVHSYLSSMQFFSP